jgi:hypothetical protein
MKRLRTEISRESSQRNVIEQPYVHVKKSENPAFISLEWEYRIQEQMHLL